MDAGKNAPEQARKETGKRFILAVRFVSGGLIPRESGKNEKEMDLQNDPACFYPDTRNKRFSTDREKQ
ncbi:hypothetical protein OFAG_02299 [Oxalobacter formigenes HOxBLS]|uniref:Uncharacterized protein n=1 Tax=Oxalobacter paraformigenes TaxID=556268 RepID=T5LE53_9BURK|nr:hypothetical protein OFAG_02299 [Oxalobacter paraformigenes]